MHLLLLHTLLLAAAPPPRSPIQLVESTRMIAAAQGASLQLKEEIWEMRSSEADPAVRRFVVPRLVAHAGRKPEGLETLNRSLRSACTELSASALQSALARDWRYLTGCSYRVLLNQRELVAIEVCNEGVGAYPFINCRQERFDARRSKPWSWLEDGISAQGRPAFDKLCREALWREAKSTPREGEIPLQCDETLFQNASVSASGDLRFTVGDDLPHALRASRFEVTLPRAQLAPLVNPTGPIAFAWEASQQTHP